MMAADTVGLNRTRREHIADGGRLSKDVARHHLL